MPDDAHLTYPPLNELKPVADDVWIIDGPVIRFGPALLNWWIPDWHAAYPDAQIYLAPKVRQQAHGRLDFDCGVLDRRNGYPWDGQIATLAIAGSYMTEVEFLHRPSRTLVLTDLIENFEP